jgi:hypothetical protein
MSGTISASNLSSVVSKYLQEYSKEVSDAVEATTETVAQKASDELKGAGKFKGRKYRNSWTFEVHQKAGYTDAVVFNKKHYRLTHLLEFGHAKQNGGRTTAFEHIAPINNEVGEMFVKELERRI